MHRWVRVGVLVAIAASAFTITVVGWSVAIKVFRWAAELQATVDCERLREQESEMPKWDSVRKVGFYVTAGDRERCAGVGIKLRAHVLTEGDVRSFKEF